VLRSLSKLLGKQGLQRVDTTAQFAAQVHLRRMYRTKKSESRWCLSALGRGESAPRTVQGACLGQRSNRATTIWPLLYEGLSGLRTCAMNVSSAARGARCTSSRACSSVSSSSYEGGTRCASPPTGSLPLHCLLALGAMGKRIR